MFGRKNKAAPSKRKPDTNLEDLRDDCIAMFLDSKLTQKQVHANGGPTPQTITRWLYRETRFPRLDTVRALLQALGGDLTVMRKEIVEERVRHVPIADRLGLSMSIDARPKMPPRKKHGRKTAHEYAKHR